MIAAKDGHTRIVKTRLDPSAAQASLLLNYTTGVNAVYNTLLYKSKVAYQAQRNPEELEYPSETPELLPVFNAYDLDKLMTRVKSEWFEWADQVPAQVFTEAAYRLVDAFKRFNSKKSKYPKFRKRHKLLDAGKQSISFKKKPNESWLFNEGTHIALPVPTGRKKDMFGFNRSQPVLVKIPKDKRVRRAYKLIEQGRAQVQKVTFSFSGGYWWVSIQLRVDDRNKRQYQRDPQQYQGGKVGIDLAFGDRAMVLSRPVPGLTDANGVVEAPHHLKKQVDHLAAVQRRLSFKQDGSNNQKRLVARQRKLHHKVKQERLRWQHDVANTLANVFDETVLEDLNISALAKRKKGKKYSYGLSVSDLAPYQFTQILKQKMSRHDLVYTTAHRFYPSSKTCSNPECKAVKAKLPVWVRVYVCDKCGLKIDRDVNASRNLEHYPPGWKPPRKTIHKTSGRDAGGSDTSRKVA